MNEFNLKKVDLTILQESGAISLQPAEPIPGFALVKGKDSIGDFHVFEKVKPADPSKGLQGPTIMTRPLAIADLSKIEKKELHCFVPVDDEGKLQLPKNGHGSKMLIFLKQTEKISEAVA